MQFLKLCYLNQRNPERVFRKRRQITTTLDIQFQMKTQWRWWYKEIDENLLLVKRMNRIRAIEQTQKSI